MTSTHKSGWYLNFCHFGVPGSEYLNRENGFGGSEIDLGIGYYDEDIYGTGLTANFLVSYWMLGDLADFKDLDTLFLLAQISKTFEVGEHSISPFVAINHYTIVNSLPFDGFIWKIGVNHGLRLSENISLASQGFLAYDEGTWGNNNGFISKIETGISWDIDRNLNIRPIALEYFHQINTHDAREDQFFLTTGATFKW